MFKNWRTTFSGLVTIGVGVYCLMTGHVETGLAAITGGLGLLVAKDGSTHSTESEVIKATKVS
jgi:hypothetical protein